MQPWYVTASFLTTKNVSFTSIEILAGADPPRALNWGSVAAALWILKVDVGGIGLERRAAGPVTGTAALWTAQASVVMGKGGRSRALVGAYGGKGVGAR